MEIALGNERSELKVFVSWSGETSLRIAEAFRDWLPSVIQAVTPYVSSEDIDKGARWSVDVASELADSEFGIICVTASNLNAPWLNFEAGALSKSFDKGRVSPFLFNLERTEVTGPLVQFQSTINERSDVLRLIHSINAATEAPLDTARLERAFDVWWPILEELLQSIAASCSRPEEELVEHSQERSIKDLLQEILSLSRAQQKILSAPEQLLPVEHIARVAQLSSLRDRISPAARARGVRRQ